VRGNGHPLAGPTPDTDARVRVHLRGARGKSVRYLARRYRLALTGYIAELERDQRDQGDLDHQGDATPGFPELDARTIVALKIVGKVAAEAARFARIPENRGQAPDPRQLVGDAVTDTLAALEHVSAGTEPEGLRRYYRTEDRAPPYVIVAHALRSIAERGKMG
jgi:hypothetical protein